MKATNVKFLYQNEINDIFSYIDEDKEVQYTSFPRSMGMTAEEVSQYLND